MPEPRNIPVNAELAGIILRETIMKLSGNHNAVKRVCRNCAGIHKGLSAKRKHCLSPLKPFPLEKSGIIKCSLSKQSKKAIKKEIKSAFPFIFLSCFLSISSFFKLINFIINFFKAAKRILIIYFIKTMKEKMKLESSLNTFSLAGSHAGKETKKQELSEINDRSALLSKTVLL